MRRRGLTPVIPADNRILYFRRDREMFEFLSHFYPSPILLDGDTWPTVEHYYQARKWTRPIGRPFAMRALPARRNGSRLRRMLHLRISAQSWFRKNGTLPRPDWDEVKLVIMRRAYHAKFSQHAALAEQLLATGDSELVEDSPSDAYWGIGRDGQGLNWAGRVLMEIRQGLRTGRPAYVGNGRES